MKPFKLVSDYEPSGDQPEAIRQLTDGLNSGMKYQTLLGVTGSGKTFSIANVIANVNRPTLVISHNKVLAAQLYSEFREFFPENAVEYFVSYYDYYQPEAYLPKTDTYIEKEVTINEEIDRLRLAATTALLQRRDVIIVASVSCIYGLGTPEDFQEMVLMLEVGKTIRREKILRQLVELQYTRNDIDFHRGTFRVRGDIIEIFPAYEEVPFRISLFGDEVEELGEFEPLRGTMVRPMENLVIYPAKHFVMPRERLQNAFQAIRDELRERLTELRSQGKLLEAERLEQRTTFDLEMLAEIGYCQGIENYSRHLSGRAAGLPPSCLVNYFPPDFLLVVDESHIMLPQLRGMYAGDRSRKTTLVEYGFRLPSAMDNRPQQFDEFFRLVSQAIFVSATPADYELGISDQVVEQIIRPTGLVDPVVTIVPATGQVDDLYGRIRERIARGERVLVTTLTKRMAEDLATYFEEMGLKVRYLHFEVETLERVEIIQGLRAGDFDVLVGVNLLREGLDLPEVSLVAILDADKEGFLRSDTSLIQVCGRAARNAAGEVVMYADKITGSMRRALDETERRRDRQVEYNQEHGIEPQTIVKSVRNILEARVKRKTDALEFSYDLYDLERLNSRDRSRVLRELKKEMLDAAKHLEFERAATIRDKIAAIEGAKHLL